MMTMRKHRLGLALLWAVTPFCGPALGQMSGIEMQIGGPLPISPFQFERQLDGIVMAEQPTFEWSRNALSPEENAELADLLSRQTELTLPELQALQNYLDRSLTVPTTPVPQPPPISIPIIVAPPTGTTVQPAGLSVLSAGKTCADGRTLPFICLYSTELDGCQCPSPSAVP